MSTFEAVTGTGMRAELEIAASPAELLLRQRTRLAERLAGLSPQGWRRRTDCPLWDVADVVTHLVDATNWALGTLAATDSGATVPSALEAFHPSTTPHEHVLAGRGQAPEVLLARLRDLTGTLADRLAADDPGVPAVRWVGENLYSRGLAGMHLLWDSWLHELDLDAALGAEGIGPEAPCPRELDAVASYGVFFAGLVVRSRLGPDAQILLRAELDELTYDLSLGASVRLSKAVGDPAPGTLAIRGPALTTVGALAGRGELAEIAQGDARALAILSGLGTRMRAPADQTPVG